MSWKKEIPNLIKKVMWLLMGTQVLLGGLWFVCNLIYMPDFQETRDMLEASKSLIVDEYMGILYPLVIRLFSVFGEYFCVPLYILQVGVAVWSYHYLLRSIFGNRFEKSGKKYIWLMAGYLVTFPTTLQCHMSVLPYSLASSLLVLLLAEVKAVMKNRQTIQTNRIIRIGSLWLLAGLLISDYGVIATIVVVPGLVGAAWKQRKRMLVYLCISALTLITMFTTLTLTQTPGSYGRVQRSVNSVLWTRFAWPYFERDGYYWDHKTWITFEEGEWAWASMYPENAIYEFGPKIEQVVGKEKAKVIFGEMAKFSAQIGKKEHLKALGRDILANAGGPFALQYQLSGRGVSYTAWNYYQMQGNIPGLTKYFVKFAIYVFEFLLLMALCFAISRRKSRKVLGVMKKAMPALLGLGAMVLWYTMIGNGMQDYLKVVPVSLFWCMLPLLELGRLAEEPVETDEK